MKPTIILTGLFALACTSASAVTVECTPGALRTLIQSPEGVTELVLTGSADASDLFFIGGNMPSLRTLDLGGVAIAAYSGPRLGVSSTWPAATIPAGAFAGSGITAVKFPTAPTAIGDYAFASTALTAVDIPVTTTAVGESAFADCRSMTRASVAVADLGGYTFRNCTALTEVTLSGTRTTGAGDFAGCTALAAVRGSEEIVNIGPRTFEACTQLHDISFGGGLRSVGERAFAESGLAVFAVPSSAPLDSIGPWAFAGCESLTDVVLPANLKAIGNGAFFDCTALQGIDMPATVAELAPYIFKDASQLSVITLSPATEHIGAYALRGAAAVSHLTLPGSVASLGDHAMEGMGGLQEVDATELESVPELGEDVFKGIDQPSVALRANGDTADAFRNASQWQDFNINDVSTSNPAIALSSGVRIMGRFNGKTLEVKARDTMISTLELFDADGRLLRRLTPGTESVAVDTSVWGADMYIVGCVTADGVHATLKLAR